MIPSIVLRERICTCSLHLRSSLRAKHLHFEAQWGQRGVRIHLSRVKYWARNGHCQSVIVNDEKEATFNFIFEEDSIDLTENV